MNIIIISYLSKAYHKLLLEIAKGESTIANGLIVLNGADEKNKRRILGDISQATKKTIRQSGINQETRSSLSTVFKETNHQEILFFDEADSLFGIRTDVKDSHDKYANLETSYLLEKIESHNNIVIIASRQRQTLNLQVMSKVDVLIQFPVFFTFFRKIIQYLTNR